MQIPCMKSGENPTKKTKYARSPESSTGLFFHGALSPLSEIIDTFSKITRKVKNRDVGFMAI